MNRDLETDASLNPRHRREGVKLLVGDVTLMGVYHGEKLPRGLWLHRRKKIFRKAEHLIMEGSEDGLNTAYTRPEDIEDLAISIFRKKRKTIYFLESDVDLRPLASKYGVDPSVVMAYTVYEETKNVLEKIFQGQFTTVSLQEYIKNTSLDIKRNLFSRSSLTEGDIAKAINKTTVGMSHEEKNGVDIVDLIHDLGAGHTEIDEYLARVRDYEEMGPRLAQLATDLPRKKVVVVGENHVPAMKAALRGLPIRQPVPWNEYKETLDPEIQRQVAVFERVSQGRAAA